MNDYFSGPEGWKVPSIRPLETLHNALTLRQMENFLKKLTEPVSRTPISSPPPGNATPGTYTPRMSSHHFPPGQGNKQACIEKW